MAINQACEGQFVIINDNQLMNTHELLNLTETVSGSFGQFPSLGGVVRKQMREVICQHHPVSLVICIQYPVSLVIVIDLF